MQLTLQGLDDNGHRGVRPLVFALSNPTNKSECTFQQAYEWSNGRVVFASGTKFPAIAVPPAASRGATASKQLVDAKNPGKPNSDRNSVVLDPAQANNCFIFPGIGLGAVAAGATAIDEDMLLAAARAVAGANGELQL